MAPGETGKDEDAPDPFPDDLDQTTEFDPADPEPVLDHASRGARDFDQTWDA